MSAIAAAVVGLFAAASLSACTSPPSAPTTPTPTPVDVSGTWTGTGSDSFSAELITWVLSQSGTTVSGTAELNAVDPADGTCGSCHKVKKGTFAGTLSGSTLSVSMEFPAGGDVPAPMCVVDLNGTATVVDRRITGSYTGTDTCEGVFADGKIELTRQASGRRTTERDTRVFSSPHIAPSPSPP